MTVDISLFTAHHEYDLQLDTFKKYFCPIHVGSSNSKVSLNIRKDNTYGKLSNFNSRYCELTALDEIKEGPFNEYIGLMHYRRIFTSPKPIIKLRKDIKFKLNILKKTIFNKKRNFERQNNIKIKNKNKLEHECIGLNKYLKKNACNFDIITPEPIFYNGSTIRQKYASHHQVEHFDLFLTNLTNIFPEFLEYVKIYENSGYYFICNMFIMKNEFFSKYWKILKTVLQKTEKEIDFSQLDAYQTRVLGFLAERFMSIFVLYAEKEMNARISCLPVASISMENTQ